MNNFVVSSNGFFKEIIFDYEKLEHIIVWTPTLREAKRFKKKGAERMIEKHNMSAFVWNPYKEEPIVGKWKVVQRSSKFNRPYGSVHTVFEWYPEKLVMESKTDVKYLSNSDKPADTYYDYNEAIEVCNVRNTEMLNELVRKMNNMSQVGE